MYWSWEVAFDVLPQLAKGVVVTVQATIVASLLAYVLGLGIAILKMSKSKLLRIVLYWTTEFIRRTPILVQLYIVFYVFLWPLTALVVFLSNVILKLFGNHESLNKVSFKKTDLDLYINELKKDLDEGEEMEHDVKIFHNALSFSEVIARDCMVPRNEIVSLEINDTVEDLKKLFLDSGHSRILIYKDNIDNIIGT